MAAQPPKLDERTLLGLMRQLLGEADQAFSGTTAIPRWRYARQFSEEQMRELLGKPFDDAGLMLAFIYARLIEIALQRLNQAPEKNLVAFLDTMGVCLLTPSPARAPLTFALTAGSPPTFIPKGTQAGTQSAGGQAAVIFETEDDFTVIPAQLVAGFTMDPKWDRYTDLTSAVGGQDVFGFTPLVGAKRMPHLLYLGDEALLDFIHSTTVEARFAWASGRSSQEVEQFFRRLVYQYQTQGAVRMIAPTLVASSGGNQVRVQFNVAETIDAETIRGVGLAEGVASRWLRAAPPTPFPDDIVAQSLQLSASQFRVSASGLLPDLAFNNNAPLDVTKDFFPFGETPKLADTFYIGSREVLSKPDVQATLHVETKSAPPSLDCEYWNGRTWTRLPRVPIVVGDETVGFTFQGDGTRGFTQNGAISLTRQANMSPRLVGEETAFWFRVRMAEGSYQGAPRVKRFDLQTATTTLNENVNAGQGIITVTEPDFAATGAVVAIGKGPNQEFVQVVKGVKLKPRGPFTPEDALMVSPPLRLAHAKGETVAHQGVSEPIATLLQAAPKDQNQLFVNTAEDIAVGAILMIDDPERREFVRVTKVEDVSQFPRLPGAAPNALTVDVAASFFKVESVIFIPFLIGYRLTTDAPLRFEHAREINLRRITSAYFIGVAEGQAVAFEQPFLPFGSRPGPEDLFYFGASTGLPPRIDIQVELEMTSPNVQLRWEFLGENGWQQFVPTSDGTNDFVQSGAIALPRRSFAAGEVNGQNNYWLRVRLVRGNYGLPIDFEPVEREDPAKGFRIKRGTGNVNAPVLTKLTLNYIAERAPTVLTQNGFLHHDRTGQTYVPFISVGQLEPATHADLEPSFYLGFDVAFPEQPVSLYVATPPRSFAGSVVKEMRAAAAVSSALPPLRWEYFNGATWKELAVLDGSNNLTESGAVEFLTPADIALLAKFDLTPRYWIRARSSENDPFDTQQLTGVFLNTVPAEQAVTVRSETLGSGSGEPNQTLSFARTPVLSGQQLLVRETDRPPDKERAVIEAEEGRDAIQERANPVTGDVETWVRWHEVANFLRSDPSSRHYLLDHTSGLLAFGDGKRGMVPPRGTNNIAATYRTGGGAAGNLPKAAIAQVKSPLPGVASVTNPVAADGGADVEALAMVKERGPQTLRHRSRAVACDNLEWLARQAAGTRVARAKCLPNINRDLRFEPGWVTLLVVPQGLEGKLSPGSELIREVETFLAERAFVGLAQQNPGRINVIGPGYIQVTVEAVVAPLDIDEAEQVKQRVRAALAAFLHPLTGGPQGTGWVFGRDVYESEVYRIIEGVTGVSHVKSLRLVPNIIQRRLAFASSPPASLELPEGSLVMTADRRKVALLAEPAPAGAAVRRIAIKGFKEGDRITKAQDLTVASLPSSVSDPREIEVQSFNSDAAGFPTGSVVMTFDGAQRTRLAEAIPRNTNNVSTVVVEDADFVARLRREDALAVLYPFPITITSVALESALIGGLQTPVQTLGIEPYEAEVAFPAGSVLATLDNRVRAPLAVGLDSGVAVTSVRTRDFGQNDALALARRDGAAPPLEVTVSSVQPVTEIVFLDDNFLVYPGKHNISIAAG